MKAKNHQRRKLTKREIEAKTHALAEYARELRLTLESAGVEFGYAEHRKDTYRGVARNILHHNRDITPEEFFERMKHHLFCGEMSSTLLAFCASIEWTFYRGQIK